LLPTKSFNQRASFISISDEMLYNSRILRMYPIKKYHRLGFTMVIRLLLSMRRLYLLSSLCLGKVLKGTPQLLSDWSHLREICAW
jgi:hypothetical protein